ncbi:MAG: T9SS type A sorting domain-containing protein [Bacteroidetes bacterium]|nr:T9SS type A sorting domain-containing protein [Bacteroidota bacterium]
MKKTIITYLFFVLTLKLIAQQNLVTNGGFENMISCPTGAGEIQQVVGWNAFRGSPDYFNSCASQGSGFSVPNTVIGFQNAASGNAYAGFYSYFPSSGQPRECLGSALTSPLVIGTKYFVNFKVNLCQIDSLSLSNCATDHIGTLFSTNQFSFSSPVSINNFAQVYSTSIISDTVNWTTIKGSFIADSAYQYFSIGNFFDDISTNKAYFFSSSTYAAYYFVDDICVSTDSIFTETWTNIKEIKDNSLVRVYPNPCKDIVIVDLKEKFNVPLILTIYNSLGQVVYIKQSANEEQITLNLSGLPSGVFLLTLSNPNEHIFKEEKIIIEQK